MPSTGNKNPYPLFIITATLGCLIAISFVNRSFSLNGHTFRTLDILADLKSSPADSTEDSDDPESVTVASKDGDSTAAPRIITARNYLTYDGLVDYGILKPQDSSYGISHFMNALHELQTGKRKKVRIAYFGDSMIEGDLITQDLRDRLQAYFGGNGVGFVPATSIVASFRTSIGHTFSKNWKDYHYKNDPPASVALGLSGHTFYPSGQSWIRYVPVKRPHLDHFGEVSVLYGNANGNLLVNDKSVPLQGGEALNAVTIHLDSTRTDVTLSFNGDDQLPVYGAAFEDGQGIYVDNFSFRGISGIEMAKLSRQMWEDVQRVRPYDLVVLHYGANVLWKPELTDYDWYEKPMSKVADSLRQVLPHTSILMVGCADKSYRKNGTYVTAPGVKALLKTQHKIASKYGFAYWNLFHAMGGEGSMKKWVESDTALANKDYTHFNFRGASKVGELLYKAIMDEYKLETH
ncbi:GDSL-type esterase/lipase family protein [Chitinophaga horti]|uniref:GDSL-type esterase/lipase family protein n=1 Tax=Chitinophaga horti TaxID=2920382 RepID=A0ABY6J284_9BACT|nr:GDSL-type esterase/lipase family protein [Chitinophaga horti]UYQ92252.1 GDSL-type esterase/lipase family protein [Chitinophaga horti]